MLPFSRSGLALAGASVLLSAWMLNGCGSDFGPPGPERSETREVELDNSEEVRAEIRMGAGEMRVHGGAAKLLEARFRYNRLRMRPEVSYHGSGFRGNLVVEEPHGVQGATNRYEWDLGFNNDKPLDLEVNCGAGETRLDLGELRLRRVFVHMGVGELRMDLRGMPKNDYEVSINGGVGEATIYLPGNNGVGIQAEASGGIGEISASGLQKHGGRYVNDALGHAKATIRLDIHGGIGEIRLIAD